MGSELPSQPDEPADQPPAPESAPPPLPEQAEAADWTPQDWRPPPAAPTPTKVAAGTDPEQIPSYGSAPPAKPPLDTVSLIALITAIPSLGLVSIPLGIWGVIRTKNKQRRGRILAVISFVVIGLWAIVGTVVGVMVGLPTTVKTAAPAPSGLVVPTTVSPTVSPAPSTVLPTAVAPSKTKIPGRQPHGPLRKAKKVYWDQLRTGDCFKGWTDTAISITRVDCRSPHEEEVTGKFNLSGSRYPGDNAVDKAGDGRCKKYFTRYVGIDWDSSAYNYDYGTPDRTSWRHGDRLVICMADDLNHPKNNRISLRKVKQWRVMARTMPRCFCFGRSSPAKPRQPWVPLLSQCRNSQSFGVGISRCPASAAQISSLKRDQTLGRVQLLYSVCALIATLNVPYGYFSELKHPRNRSDQVK